jgi:hypothetical protein
MRRMGCEFEMLNSEFVVPEGRLELPTPRL